MADKKKPVPSEVAVLEKALAQIRRGYTNANYFQSSPGVTVVSPGADVVLTCAVGGVEQAIWRLAKEDVSNERHRIKAVLNERITETEPVLKLYAKVMKRLNRVAHRRTDPNDSQNEKYRTVEEVTFSEPKKAVVAVFEEALAEARAAAEKKRERAVA